MICDHARKLTIRSLGPWPKDALRNGFPGYGIRLTPTPAGFGGTRNWFLCPICERRCGILYSHHQNDWACRICCKGRYASEVEGPIDRLYRKARKLRCRLGQLDPNMSLPFPGKPLGMHWSTYLRLRKEGLALEARLIQHLRRNLPGPARRRMLEISIKIEAESEEEMLG
jgi:hypothetical protein